MASTSHDATTSAPPRTNTVDYIESKMMAGIETVEEIMKENNCCLALEG
jgi:hypothetical protein